MSHGLIRSSSRGEKDINDLLKNIRGIIDDNNKVLGDCRSIQRKNSEIARTKRVVDIVSLTAGRKRNEIDIPYNAGTTGELQGQIIKHAVRDNQEVPGPDTPRRAVAEYIPPVHSVPDEERRKRSLSREQSRDRIDRLAWLKEKEARSSSRTTVRRISSSERRRASMERRRSSSLSERRSKDYSFVVEPRETELASDRSRTRTRSVSGDGDRPVLGIRIRKDSENSIDIVPEYVTENHVVYESVTPPCTERRDESPSRGYMDKVLSRSSSLADYKRNVHHRSTHLRRRSTPSITTNTTNRSREFSHSSNSKTEILKDRYFVESNDESDRGDSITRDYSPHGRSRRRITLERRRDSESGDTAPEIEIKICSKDICLKNYRFTPERSSDQDKENKLDDVTTEDHDVTPDPPSRSSSFGKVANTKSKRQHSPGALKKSRSFEKRPQSPSSIEVEKMSRRLDRLKKDVETLARQSDSSPTNHDTQGINHSYQTPLNVRVSSPTRNKTTSTSDIICSNPANEILTYHPAKEELLAASQSDTSTSERIYHVTSRDSSTSERIPSSSLSDRSTISNEIVGSTISTQTHTKSTTLELEVVSVGEVEPVHQTPHHLTSHDISRDETPVKDTQTGDKPPVPERAPCTPPPSKRNSMSKINYDTNEDLPPPMPPRNISSPKSYNFSSPSSPKPAPHSPKPEREITLIPENLYDPMHIGTTYMLLSRKYHGMFRFANPDDPNDTKTPPTPTLRPAPSKRALYQPKSYALSKPSPSLPTKPSPSLPTKPSPALSRPTDHSPGTPRREGLYTPYSLSIASLSREESRPHSPPTKLEPDHTYDTYTPPSPTTYTPPSPRAEPPPLYDSSPPRSPVNDPRYVSVLPVRKHSVDSVPMSPEQRRKFNRPHKGDSYREVPVDCGAGAPPDLLITAPQTPVLARGEPATRDYMISDMSRDQRDTSRDGLSPDCSYSREPLPNSSPALYRTNSSQRSLRMKIPNVKFAGDEWKELAQCLGFDNMTISNISSDYPNPGLAMIEMWAKQPGSELDELMYHLKRMKMWNAADTLERTVSPISV